MMIDELGEKIRNQRERLGLTQNELASKLGVSAQAVSRWERGQNAPDIAVLPQLASMLKVTTDWLLSGFRENLAELQAMCSWVCCPYCEGELRPCPSQEPALKKEYDLHCASCDVVFPHICGIPVLMPLESIGFISDQELHAVWQKESPHMPLAQFAIALDRRCNPSASYHDLLYDAVSQFSKEHEELNDADYAQSAVAAWHEGTKALRDFLCDTAVDLSNENSAIAHLGMGEQIVFQLAETAKKPLRIVTIDRGILAYEREAARKRFGTTAPAFIGADIRAMPFPSGSVNISIDYTGSADTLECGKALSEVTRITTPKGFVILGDLDEVPELGAKSTAESYERRCKMGKSLGYDWTVEQYKERGFHVLGEKRGILPGADGIPRASAAIFQRV